MVFHTAIKRAEATDNDVNLRVLNLIDNITYSVFVYTSRGLFEKDKLTFTSQVAFQILLKSGQIDPSELDFLLRFPSMPNVVSPVDFLSNHCWGGIKALSVMEQFKNLDRDLEVGDHGMLHNTIMDSHITFNYLKGSVKRWKKFVDSECPEKERFPQEWKNKNSLQKLCMMRSLRPDRMTYAVA